MTLGDKSSSQIEASRKPGKLRATGTMLANLTRAAFKTDQFIDWDKRREEAQDNARERAAWVNQRADDLIEYAHQNSLRHEDIVVFARERANLELFCMMREKLPYQGMDWAKLRLQGFKVNTEGLSDMPWQNTIPPETLQVIFPDGWDMQPKYDLKSFDSSEALWATVTDSEGNARFDVFYKDASYEFRASMGPAS